jgi:hypothetical protein
MSISPVITGRLACLNVAFLVKKPHSQPPAGRAQQEKCL